MQENEEEPVRVLIVDDEAAQMTALANTLRDCGYETVGYTNGEAALAELQSGRFQALLADLMMPGMDGIALLRKAHAIDPDLAAIIMTGEGTIATAVEAMQVGALDYILKPFKLSLILPAISRALTVRGLRVRNAELEHSLRERAVKLEAANRDLESFSYSVSHDLRAPLRAVLGYARILDEDHAEHLDEDGRHVLASILASGQRMEKLIDGLLEFSRLGRQAMESVNIDMSALARQVLGEVLDGNEKPAVDIENLPPACGDPVLLRQVWSNLLGNAVKFSQRKDRPHIQVTAARSDQQTVYCVRDNGAGFDMQYANRLFGVFQRLHDARAFEGTGVGLAIAQRIVTRHGGRIWAEAREGEGAAFYFALPAGPET